MRIQSKRNFKVLISFKKRYSLTNNDNFRGIIFILFILFLIIILIFNPVLPILLVQGHYYHRNSPNDYIESGGSFEEITKSFEEEPESNRLYCSLPRQIRNLDMKTEYLIITPEIFLDVVEPLAAWKSQKGVYTKVVTLDGANGIKDNYAGSDLSERIHSFLREFKNNTPNLKWLLLIGDSEIIPARLILLNNSVNASFENPDNFCYSDYYYSALNTTWDENLNQVYGETGEDDFIPDLYIGRLPVNTYEETENVITKILTYEQMPPTGDWSRRALLCGALMDRPNIPDNLSTQTVDEGYNSYKDNAYEVINKLWNYLPTYTINISLLDYSKIIGGPYIRDLDTLNESNVMTVFNQGLSTANFVSHGNKNGVLHYNGKDGRGYTYDYYFNHDTAKRVTNDNKLPLIYSSSCTSGNFTEVDDTNLELLLRSPEGGAIGFIGATVDTFRLEFLKNDSSYGNWWLNFEFWKRFYSGIGDFRPGEILYNLKSDYYLHYKDINNPHPEPVYQSLYRTNFFSYNLLGDPEIQIYTDKIRTLTVDYPKTFSPIFSNSKIKIAVFDEQNHEPIEDAQVCIFSKDLETYYEVNHTNSNGIAEFGLDLKYLKNLKTLNFTVTSHNYLYFSDNIEINSKEDLKVKDDKIAFNKNPIPPGFDVNISFEIFNNGTSLISEVYVISYFDEMISENIILPSYKIYNLSSQNIERITFNWTPPEGSHKIIIQVDPNNDVFEFNEQNNIAQSLLIENKPPEILLPPEIDLEEDSNGEDILDLTGYAWDEDTKLLQFELINVSDSRVNLTINGTKVSIKLPLNYFGIVTAIITVSDGTSLDQAELKVIIHPVNDPPIINQTTDWYFVSQNITVAPDKLTVFEDQIVDFLFTGYDIDDNSSKLRYYSNSKLFTVNSTNGRVTFITTNSMVGTHLINFSITDGNTDNNVSWLRLLLEVENVNDPPELILPKSYIYAEVGDEIEFKVRGYDIDPDDKLTFSDDTDLFDVDPILGNISFITTFGQLGKHTIGITVSDGVVNSTKILTIEITSPPEKPLDPTSVLICPIILFILIIYIVTQEYLKNKRSKLKEKKEN